MQGLELVFYTKENGEVPVWDFLQILLGKMKAKAIKEFDTLAEYGNVLREPYTKYMSDGIFELRIKAGSDISRVFYFYYEGRQIVFTNGFIKKTDRTPIREILKAKKYRSDYRKRREHDEI